MLLDNNVTKINKQSIKKKHFGSNPDQSPLFLLLTCKVQPIETHVQPGRKSIAGWSSPVAQWQQRTTRPRCPRADEPVGDGVDGKGAPDGFRRRKRLRSCAAPPAREERRPEEAVVSGRGAPGSPAEGLIFLLTLVVLRFFPLWCVAVLVWKSDCNKLNEPCPAQYR